MEREYQRRIAPQPMRALFWTGDNTTDALDWMMRLGHTAAINDEGDLQVEQIYRGVPGGVIELAEPGDYLYTDDEGLIRTQMAAAFDSRFRLA